MKSVFTYLCCANTPCSSNTMTQLHLVTSTFLLPLLVETRLRFLKAFYENVLCHEHLEGSLSVWLPCSEYCNR